MKRFINTLKPEDVITKLKQGIVLKDDEIDDTYELIDGFLVRKTRGNWIIGDVISSSEKIYFDEPEPELEVVIGRFYKTRDDRRAFVFSKNSDGEYCVVIENELPYTVSKNGYFSDYEETDKDLVSEWKLKKEYYVKDKVIQGIRENKTYEEIAREVGISHTTVASIKRKNGFKMRHIGKNEERYKKYTEFLKKGFSNEKIAEELGLTYATVANYISSRPELKKIRKEAKVKVVEPDTNVVWTHF